MILSPKGSAGLCTDGPVSVPRFGVTHGPGDDLRVTVPGVGVVTSPEIMYGSGLDPATWRRPMTAPR